MKRARFDADAVGGQPERPSKISRKVTACQQCQTRKVKCDLASGQSRCVRCARLGLECVVNRSLQTLLDGENEWKHNVERHITSLQDHVDRLYRMLADPQQQQQQQQQPPPPPPPFAVVSPSSAGPSTGPSPQRGPAITAMTRENSPEPAVTAGPAGGGRRSRHGGLMAAPMDSLFEATKLRNIRSDPGSHEAVPGHAREPDFIDHERVDSSLAERLFNAFQGTLNSYLWGGIALVHATLASARASSPLLVSAILAVTALHEHDDGRSFDLCYPVFLELASQSMFQRYHVLDDVRGLCIGAFWLSDVSWKLSGLAVRIATELNLHHHSTRALGREKACRRHADRARLWYLLYVCDHHFSIAYGRPPVIPEDVTIARHESFLDLADATQADCRLHSQVAVFRILSRVCHTFGLDRSRLVANDEFDSIRRYDADLLAWKKTWEARLLPDPNISNYPAKGVDLHYHFAQLQLFSVCLRGLEPAEQQYLVSSERRIFIERAVESATAVLRLIVDDPDMRKAITGVPLYLLTTIAYASIFLIKVQSEWRAAGFRITHEDVAALLESVVAALESCRACARHVAHYLGKGLGAMLVKFKEREAAYQAQVQAQAHAQAQAQAQAHAQTQTQTHPQQMAPHLQPAMGIAQLGWDDWMQGAVDMDVYYPAWLDVLGSQMPGGDV